MMVVLSIIGIVYGALVALAQKDMKKLVAYSSVSHLGFVMLGMFALNPMGLQGCVLQMINHGISTGALFLLVGVIYERRHTRMIAEYGGLAKRDADLRDALPASMTLSLDGPAGAERLRRRVHHPARRLERATSCGRRSPPAGIVLGAAYLLWLYQRTMFGKIENPKNENLKDLNLREVVVFVPLIILALWIGVYPTPFLDRLDTSVNRVIARVSPHIEHLAAQPGDCAQPVAAASKFTQPACGDATPDGAVRIGAGPRGTGQRARGADGRAAGTTANRNGHGGNTHARSGQAGGRALMTGGYSAVDFLCLRPKVVLSTAALLVLLADAFLPRARQSIITGCPSRASPSPRWRSSPWSASTPPWRTG